MQHNSVRIHKLKISEDNFSKKRTWALGELKMVDGVAVHAHIGVYDEMLNMRADKQEELQPSLRQGYVPVGCQ